MKSFKNWIEENAMAANSTAAGGIDGIGPDTIKVGGKKGVSVKDGDSESVLRDDNYRARVRTSLLQKLGLNVQDRNSQLYDPEPYEKDVPFAQGAGNAAKFN